MAHRSPNKALARLGLIALVLVGAWTEEATAAGNRPGPSVAAMDIAYQRTVGTSGPSQIWSMYGNGKHRIEISGTPPGASDSWPAAAQGDGRVLWQRVAGGVPQIMGGVLFAPDNPEQLTKFAGGAIEPSISRDGQRMAFSVLTSGSCDVWIADSFGEHPRRLTDHGQGAQTCDLGSAWSPDGRRIAFVRMVGDLSNPTSSQAFLIPATGGTPTPLGLPAGAAFLPSWNPGGDLLIRAVTPDGTGQVVAFAADGPASRVIFSGAGLVGMPSWSPLSANIAVTQLQPDGSTDILTVPAPGGQSTNITQTPGISESHPSWGWPSNQGNAPGPGVHARSVRPGRKRPPGRHR